MKKQLLVLVGVLVLALLAVAIIIRATHAQGPETQGVVNAQVSSLGSSFTYQGKLKNANGPVTANCTMTFRLYDDADAGSQIGNTAIITVPITNGLFTVVLNDSGQFGPNAFAGEARWLSIKVKCPGDAIYADLGRQALTAAPYALHACSTGALQGYPVTTTVPTADQVLKWDGSAWAPAADEVGSSDHTHSSLHTPPDGDPQPVVVVDQDSNVGITGSVGIGTTSPGEALHIDQGNILISSPSEQEIRMHHSSLPNNPTFRLGRMVIAGDGSPEFRILYSDDVTPERSVLEFDDKGIVASVKQNLGSHFEGFLAGDSQPLFRLNSFPSMQLEFGSGGSIPTDVAIRRETTRTLTFLTGEAGSEIERVRIDKNGNVGIGTTSPNNGRLHVASGNDQLILEDSDGGTDARQWLFSADTNLLKLMTANDSFTSWANAIVVERNGVSITYVSFPAGNIGIGTTTPQSALEVDGYVQLDTLTSAPPAADCDEASERGRMKVDIVNNLLYICTNSGWTSK